MKTVGDNPQYRAGASWADGLMPFGHPVSPGPPGDTGMGTPPPSAGAGGAAGADQQQRQPQPERVATPHLFASLHRYLARLREDGYSPAPPRLYSNGECRGWGVNTSPN